MFDICHQPTQPISVRCPPSVIAFVQRRSLLCAALLSLVPTSQRSERNAAMADRRRVTSGGRLTFISLRVTGILRTQRYFSASGTGTKTSSSVTLLVSGTCWIVVAVFFTTRMQLMSLSKHLSINVLVLGLRSPVSSFSSVPGKHRNPSKPLSYQVPVAPSLNTNSPGPLWRSAGGKTAGIKCRALFRCGFFWGLRVLKFKCARKPQKELQLDCKMVLLVWTSPHQSAT